MRYGRTERVAHVPFDTVGTQRNMPEHRRERKANQPKCDHAFPQLGSPSERDPRDPSGRFKVGMEVVGAPPQLPYVVVQLRCSPLVKASPSVVKSALRCQQTPTHMVVHQSCKCLAWVTFVNGCLATLRTDHVFLALCLSTSCANKTGLSAGLRVASISSVVVTLCSGRPPAEGRSAGKLCSGERAPASACR